MEWIGPPLVLSGVQRLLLDIAPKWCADNLPMMSLEWCESLHIALVGTLNVSEAELCLKVKTVLLNMDEDMAFMVDNCLQGLTLKQYITKASNVGTAIDCLFIWLVSWAYAQHMNIIHGDGIWTTHQSAIPDLRDPVLVLTLTGYLFGTSVNKIMQK